MANERASSKWTSASQDISPGQIMIYMHLTHLPNLFHMAVEMAQVRLGTHNNQISPETVI